MHLRCISRDLPPRSHLGLTAISRDLAQLNYGVSVTDVDGDHRFEAFVCGYGYANTLISHRYRVPHKSSPASSVGGHPPLTALARASTARAMASRSWPKRSSGLSVPHPMLA